MSTMRSGEGTIPCGGFEAAAAADAGFCDTIPALAYTVFPSECFAVVEGFGEDMSADSRSVAIPPSSRIPSFGTEYSGMFSLSFEPIGRINRYAPEERSHPRGSDSLANERS
jgi:hypothetical protein